VGRDFGRNGVTGVADTVDSEAALPSGRMGKAVEYLVASSCILASRGELNASTSLVDDEGVDLVFNRRGSTATLAVQVKARLSTSKRVQGETFVAHVRSQTFHPRPDLDLLFVAVEVTETRLMAAWLVSSEVYAAGAGEPSGQGRYRFYASMKPNARDKWVDYRLSPAELAPRILARLDELGK
jgi:hypothetical protein